MIEGEGSSAQPRLPDSKREEISVATELIIEYTQRLLSACHAVAREQVRRSMLAALFAGCIAAIGLVLNTLGVRIQAYALLAALFGASGGFLLVLRMGGALLSRDEVRLTARGLAVLVRHASAVYEHRSVSFAERLLLQVRLGEAEAALEISSRYGGRAWAAEPNPKELASPHAVESPTDEQPDAGVASERVAKSARAHAR